MAKYRYGFSKPVKVCMACAGVLKSDKEREYGLCDYHQNHIIQPPCEVRRNFGRGVEYQLLRHTDELDDIINKLESNEDTDIFDSSEEDGAREYTGCGFNQEYLIFSHYLAKIFLERLQANLSLTEFDYAVYADSGFVSMELIFTEMGYQIMNKEQAGLFMQGQLQDLIQDQLYDQENALQIFGSRILLLDLYRSTDTRTCLDRLRLSGAGEVVTVYLTSYS